MPQPFSARHLGTNPQERQEMLEALGLESMEQLIDQTIPASLPRCGDPNVGAPLNEDDALRKLAKLANENERHVSMIGCGYHGTRLPSVIRRNVLENPDWYTAYTPYQPEIAQGRLEALMIFQQMVMDLTGMEIANASMLDEATAAAEAMTMSKRLSKNKSMVYFVDSDAHPQTIAVMQTRAEPMGIEIILGNPKTDLVDQDVYGAFIQYPASTGIIHDYSEEIAAVQAAKGLVTMGADVMALAVLKSPGEMGADIAIGTTQRFGVPMGYGGPHAAYFATMDQHKRSVPGRIIGLSIDAQGDPAYRMALQTREQHIRREKATSNICTAQALLAIIAALYCVYHGPNGVKRIAQRINHNTRLMADKLKQINVNVVNDHYFDTLLISAPGQARRAVNAALENDINIRFIDNDSVSITLDETHKEKHINALVDAFASPFRRSQDIVDNQTPAQSIPKSLMRTTAYFSHQVFSEYRNETAMMRFLRGLSQKDITLARSMIPLGSCTMKLNSATEMDSVSNPRFAKLHPFVPVDQAKGYKTIIDELSRDLCEITGYDSLSMQPNAGSQGEYAGLLCIRKYHISRGDSQRTICLIPSSAHGTNPASAVMAGMKVVIIQCTPEGNIDLDDLNEKADKHSNELAALMITYPSTFGVFESSVQEVCQITHNHGGQVYLDGANLNAMIGLVRPGDIGGDVSHLNLHKTFAIPHGGGGPGMGPIGVKKHLAPFLPDHVLVDGVNDSHNAMPIGSVSAAPWGSPLILTISWAYVKMLGSQGLSKATRVAILNSNYIASALKEAYPVRYTGDKGRVAHECIIDCSAFKDSAGILVEDIAKRLMDYGFHSPTMSWPVHDSLMIEPTESEPKSEIDRFIRAMLSIRGEIALIEKGAMDKEDNPLKNAPHSNQLIDIEDWEHPYSRKMAFFPMPGLKHNKYWPPVGRIDNIYGDKNLNCSCPPMESYLDEDEHQ
ncbi:MAG: glycine dehydrogenase [Saprospiraceae bacterium]|jgi:glycine dehydrogenase